MPPRPPRYTLFPYTTLFRSRAVSRSGTRARSAIVSKSIGVCSRPNAPSRRSEEHTSELQSHSDLVCRLLLEKKNRLFVAGRLWLQSSLRRRNALRRG